MASETSDEKWYFTKEQLENTPSRLRGISADKELSYRQQAAKFIQDMGQRLSVTQLCINTAIVYMHRFYVFHSFSHFPWYSIAAAALFLAAKVEEQPRKLEYVIRMANSCRHPNEKPLDPQSEQYQALSQDLVFNENVLLQTLGFDVAIDHPHTHVVKCCHLVRASKDLAQTSYFMASNTLHLTTMCLQYKPTVVACFCIHLSCKWANWKIPLSNEQREWFYYVDKTVTAALLEQVTDEFLEIFDKYPTRLKHRISQGQQINSLNFDADSKKKEQSHTDGNDGSHHSKSHHMEPKPGPSNQDESHKRRSHDQNAEQEKLYRQKKERERMAHQKPHPPGSNPSSKHPPPHGSGHHRPDPNKMKPDPNKMRPSGSSGMNHVMNSSRPSREIPGPTSSSTSSTAGGGGGAGGREWDDVGPWGDSLTREPSSSNTTNQIKDIIRSGGSKDISLSSMKSGGGDSSANVRSAHPEKQIRPPPDPSKFASSKHDPSNRVRREESSKQFSSSSSSSSSSSKLPPDSSNSSSNDKRHSSSSNSGVNSVQDKQSAFLSTKPNNATSQRLKSPFSSDTTITSKSSVPTFQSSTANKLDARNGTYAMPSAMSATSPPPPPPVKKSHSLFSPEQTTPPRRPKPAKTPPSVGQRLTDTPQQLPTVPPVPPVLSPFSATPTAKSSAAASNSRRNRTPSSGSEPELRPVVKKLDQMSGFENILKDTKMAIKLPKVPDIIQPIADTKPEFPISRQSIAKEFKPPDLITPFNIKSENGGSVSSQQQSLPLVNGIETNPALISNLLKEAPAISHLSTVTAASSQLQAPPPTLQSTGPLEGATIGAGVQQEYHHKSEKKKKKEKHKHKDKSKSKEEKEKKKKHKDKDREKHKIKVEKGEEVLPAVPIKITIPKDKIKCEVREPTIGGASAPNPLKIKIAKDKIKTESLNDSVGSNTSLKIKISKDQISSYGSSGSESRKRERDRTSSPPVGGPPTKASKTSSYGRGAEMRQNGRSSYAKVTQGDGDSLHRLAESKYLSKAPPPQ